MANKIKFTKKKAILLIGIAVIIILVLIQQKPAVEVGAIGTIPGEWDISEEVKAAGLEQYLIEEPDFDYSDSSIYTLAQEIKENSKNPEEAIKETLRFVVSNIRYSSAITVNYCFDEKASTVLRSGFSDCVGMTRLVVSLLRAQGIPVRSVGGCLSSFKRCTPVFSVIPLLDAQTTKMVEDDFKKRGFLHEWVEIWTPNEDWRMAEPTSGQLYSASCSKSDAYLRYSYDTNPKDRCVIIDQRFWNQCKSY